MKAFDLLIPQSDLPVSPRPSQPESARKTGLPSFRLPLNNLKLQKPEEDSPVLFNPESPAKTARPKAKIAFNIDLSSPLKLETPKTLSNVFGLKVNTHRPTHSESKLSSRNESIISPKITKSINSETVTVRVRPPSSHTSVNSPMLRIPIDDDLYRDGEGKRKSFGTTISNCDDMHLLTEQSPLNPPTYSFGQDEAEDNLDKNKTGMQTLCSTMESSGQFNQARAGSLNQLNSPSSPSNHHRKLGPCKTVKEMGIRTTINTPKGSPIIYIRKVAKRQTEIADRCLTAKTGSKTLNKITDAFEKAKQYNDQVILQYQFEKQNEEEERDFCELYELLQTNMGK